MSDTIGDLLEELRLVSEQRDFLAEEVDRLRPVVEAARALVAKRKAAGIQAAFREADAMRSALAALDGEQ